MQAGPEQPGGCMRQHHQGGPALAVLGHQARHSAGSHAASHRRHLSQHINSMTVARYKCKVAPVMCRARPEHRST